MKRLSIILLVAILSLPIALADTKVSANDLFEEFSCEHKAESVNVNSFLMWIAKRFAGNEPGSEILNKISSVRVLDLEDCATDVKTRFADRTKNIAVEGMETLIDTNDGGNKVKILAKMKNETIHRLLIISSGPDDCCLVEIKGKFRLDELEDVAKSQMPKRNDR